MAFTMQDFIREFSIEHFAQIQEVVRSMPPEKRQRIMDALPAEERLASMSPEQIQKYLDKLTANKGPARGSRDGRSSLNNSGEVGLSSTGCRQIFVALDIFVMPLWRYKVGDFRSPSKRVQDAAQSSLVPTRLRVGRAIGFFGRWKARRQVAAIRRAVDAANHTHVRWNDEGGVVYAQQSRGIEPLVRLR